MKGSSKFMMDKKLRMRLRKKFEEENNMALNKQATKAKGKSEGKPRNGGSRKKETLSIEKEESGNKIYTCHVLGCGKIFNDSSSLRKHLMTHGER